MFSDLAVWLRIVLAAALSFAVSYLMVPQVKKFAESVHAVDEPSARRINDHPVPRMGGIAIFCGFMAAALLFAELSRQVKGILIGCMMIAVMGGLDDIFNLNAWVKLACQIAAAIVAVSCGVLADTFTNFMMEEGLIYPSDLVSAVITVIWIVGCTNAINLIDGLDGLSCGITMIVLCVIGFISYQMRRIDVTIVALILFGSIGGVLPFNFNPASIFVGDCGALFMGFMISCLSLLGFKSSTFVSLIFPLIILFVPLADTSLAIIRRKLKGQKISEADRSHLHHVLMYKVGLSHKNTVLLLYLVTLLFGGDAILMFFNEKIGTLVLFVLCLIAWIFIEKTGMIKPGFQPVLGLSRKITGHSKKAIATKVDNDPKEQKD